jgi:hypothetical protein
VLLCHCRQASGESIGSSNTEESYEVVRNACDGQEDAYGESGKSGETVREIVGGMVLKLFDAMNDERQVGTIEAMAKSKNITGARAPTLDMAAV